MSSRKVTNYDLSESEEVLNIEEKQKESNESNNTSPLNSQDQEEVQSDSSQESQGKQKDPKDPESEPIVQEAQEAQEVQEGNQYEEKQEKQVIDDNNNDDLNNKPENELKQDNEEFTNETDQVSKENIDQSTTTTPATPIISSWRAVWDENAQAYYYWNTVTNETTWENPDSINYYDINNFQNIDYLGYDYYYSQYGYYPEYYYGYDNSLTTSTDTSATTTEPPINRLDSILDKIDKEVKSKLDKNSSKLKNSSSTTSDTDSKYNGQQNNQDQQEKLEEEEQTEQPEQPDEQNSSVDIDSYYNQDQITNTTLDPEYQAFLSEHGGNDGTGDYKLTARFNAKTGKFQRDPNLNPEKFSAESKAIRQMSYFFDYDQFAESRGSSASKRLSSEASLGDSIRSPKKLNKKDIEMFKQKKKEKKDMKKKSWLLSDD